MSANPHTQPIAYGLEQLTPLVLDEDATPEQHEQLRRAFYAGAWLTYRLCKLGTAGQGMGGLVLLNAVCDELEGFAGLAGSQPPAVPTRGAA